MSDRPLPEQTFFADPAIDRLLGMVMTLAGEVWVLRERVRALETPGAAQPDAEAAVRDRAAFVRQLMENLLGDQVSRGAPTDLMARFPDAPRGAGHD